MDNIATDNKKNHKKESEDMEMNTAAVSGKQADTLNKPKDKKGIAALWQFIKFGLVGVSNTVVSYVTYSVCYYVLHTNVHVANIAGFVISVLNAYFWQNKFVFKESKDGEHRVWWQVLIKTYISYAFSGLFLSEVLLLLWLNVIKIGQYLEPIATWLNGFGLAMTAEDVAVSIAPFLNMVVTIPINFCINKFWAYRQKGKKSEVTE